MNLSRTKKFYVQKKKKTEEKKYKGLFAEAHAVAPAPSRDYYALQVYQKKFLWTRWKISHGPYASPLQRVISLDVFSKDLTMQNELTYIFGEDTTSLINDLANEKWSLTSMPSNVLQKIFSYMNVSDILKLSQVCKRLSKECSKNELWQSICKNQWKILIHNDIEKAELIGWKNVYLEKMRPKRYKAFPNHQNPKSSILQRNRVNSASPLNTPDSKVTSKSNFTINKKIQEIKKADKLRATSEIFSKDFKVTSISTGRSTDRTFPSKARPLSKNYDLRPNSSGKLTSSKFTPDRKLIHHQSSDSTVNLVPLMENYRANEPLRKTKSPRKPKSKVTSIRTRPVTAQSLQPTNNKKTDMPRLKIGKIVEAKH